MGKEKAEALELIQKLPDEITTDGILEELFFKRMIDRGYRTSTKAASSPIKN